MRGIDVKGKRVEVRKAQYISHSCVSGVGNLNVENVHFLLRGNISKEVFNLVKERFRCHSLASEWSI